MKTTTACSVLITGANGNLGKKLREAWAEAYDLVLIDQNLDPDDSRRDRGRPFRAKRRPVHVLPRGRHW